MIARLTGRVRVEVMLNLQEGWIEVLRSMTEEVERRHEDHGIQGQLPMLSERCEHRLTLSVRRCPSWRLRYVTTDVEHQHRRHQAQHEHSAPAHHVVELRVDHRRDEVAGRITRLQNSRHQPARFGFHGLHGQRRADPPFPSHGHPEQRAERQKHAPGSAQKPSRTPVPSTARHQTSESAAARTDRPAAQTRRPPRAAAPA